MSEKKTVLITGATSGIGLEMVKKFAINNWNVIGLGRNDSMLKNMMKDHQLETRVHFYQCDLGDNSQIEDVYLQIAEKFSTIDVLINNAGVLILKPFMELTTEEFEQMWQVNMHAVFMLTKLVLPGMIERKNGTIVNISSLAGKNGFKTGTGYGATKWALRGFAASLMQEVREHNIRVITVFPGSVNTPMIRRAPNFADPDSIIQPNEIADVVFQAVSLPGNTTVSEIDIRPTNPKYGG
ncbi:MAG: 3-ketoacyl-ACP reductase [Calditrichia bacterium]